PYTRTCFSERLTTALLLAAAFAAFEARRGSTLAHALLGLSLGFGVLTREDTAALLPFFAIYVLWPRLEAPPEPSLTRPLPTLSRPSVPRAAAQSERGRWRGPATRHSPADTRPAKGMVAAAAPLAALVALTVWYHELRFHSL